MQRRIPSPQAAPVTSRQLTGVELVGASNGDTARRLSIADHLIWPAAFVAPLTRVESATAHAIAAGVTELLVVSSDVCIGVVRLDDLHGAPRGATVLACTAAVTTVQSVVTLREAQALFARGDDASVVCRWRGQFGILTRAARDRAVVAFDHGRRRRDEQMRERESGVFRRIFATAAPADEFASLYYADVGGG